MSQEVTHYVPHSVSNYSPILKYNIDYTVLDCMCQCARGSLSGESSVSDNSK